jgi:hypothetical protein
MVDATNRVRIGKSVLTQLFTYEHDSLGAHLATSEVDSDILFFLPYL